MPLQAAAASAIPISGAQANVLTGMFEWWNEAIQHPDGFTEAGFARWFTDDARLVINGKLSAQGIPALTAHFRRIQARTDSVRIVLPFRDGFVSADGRRIFTYHFIRSLSPNGPVCMRAMGYADLRDGRIATIHLTRAEEPVGPEGDPACRA
ncbi:nuclear transport factor 2 family protein [Stenotrophomonas sp. MMGLT7]|uniref:nuclear transport factor 2 family protein n=1 Tax=Stenotrophomonas sp. MMGLT7 TaxID=2901227 RepID=UPI001E42D0F5|nr:nuclear transport factor 2 family protein [Stenotrophomonas sp. MMGLT7]MCD7098794.1 nuclear transport factor 2 family protein [Stenotrophomonas sp. MMGLT7]